MHARGRTDLHLKYTAYSTNIRFGPIAAAQVRSARSLLLGTCKRSITGMNVLVRPLGSQAAVSPSQVQSPLCCRAANPHLARRSRRIGPAAAGMRSQIDVLPLFGELPCGGGFHSKRAGVSGKPKFLFILPAILTKPLLLRHNCHRESMTIRSFVTIVAGHPAVFTSAASSKDSECGSPRGGNYGGA